MRALLLAAVAAVLGAGCSKADLSDASFVSGLRLLGVQAEPPEVLPGNQVTLTAWVVDTKGGAVDVRWSACMLPSNGLANAGCTDGSGRGLAALGSGQSLAIAAPAVDAATLGPPDATDGVYLPVVVHVSAPDAEPLDAVYRLRMRVRAPFGCTLLPPYNPGCALNQNPTLARIDPLPDDGAPVATHAGQVWGLLARYSGDSMEQYEIPSPQPDVYERLTTQWFATAGTFPDQPVGGTAVQKLTFDRALPPPGGIIDLWVVGHDDRGGTAMLHRSFVLQ